MKWQHVLILTAALIVGCGDDAKDEPPAGNGKEKEKEKRKSSPEVGPSHPASGSGAGPREYSDQERKILLDLARETLNAVVAGQQPPKVDLAALPPKLMAEKGCFVTLNKAGRLRGCIGYILPNGPLYKAVMANTVNAAIRDRRFPPVQMSELTEIDIEISVLTVPQPLAYESFDDLLGKLRPNVDGVLFRAGAAQATYLPTVWKTIPKKREFLMKLSEKAGLRVPEESWKPDRVMILTYQAEVFDE